MEIEKMSDLELTNYFVNKAVPNTRALTEEERLYREEILQRLSKNNIDNKFISDLIEEVYNGVYGTKNRVQLIQKLEIINNLK